MTLLLADRRGGAPASRTVPGDDGGVADLARRRVLRPGVLPSVGAAAPILARSRKEPALSLAQLHEVWAWVIVVANAIAGGWALAAHWRPDLRSIWLWRFTAAAEVAIVAQVVLGVVLIQRGRVAPEFHLFYGFVALASIGIIYSYRQQLEPWRHLLYGFGGLFLMGLALRAVFLSDTATTTIG